MARIENIRYLSPVSQRIVELGIRHPAIECVCGRIFIKNATPSFTQHVRHQECAIDGRKSGIPCFHCPMISADVHHALAHLTTHARRIDNFLEQTEQAVVEFLANNPQNDIVDDRGIAVVAQPNNGQNNNRDFDDGNIRERIVDRNMLIALEGGERFETFIRIINYAFGDRNLEPAIIRQRVLDRALEIELQGGDRNEMYQYIMDIIGYE